MKPLVRVILILGLCFITIFLITRSTGWLTAAQIEGWLEQARTISPFYLASLVVFLLVADLLVSIPTMIVTLLAGYFLGHLYGVSAVLCGLMLAGMSGYGLGYYAGKSILRLLVRDRQQRLEAMSAFARHGFTLIALSRAVPMLPEITACMAGATRMPFRKFLLAWSLNSIPYAIITTYAGSISSLDNPAPALLTAIGISVLLWTGGFVFHHLHSRNRL